MRYYIPNPPALQALRSDVTSTQKTLADQQTALNSALALQNQVTTLNTQILTLQATHAQALALRDQQMRKLIGTGVERGVAERGVLTHQRGGITALRDLSLDQRRQCRR